MGDYGLRPGRVELGSAGPIAFGPAGILFLADSAGAKVHAVDIAGGETAAPIRTFMPYEDGRSILASYSCTPVVTSLCPTGIAGDELLGCTTCAEPEIKLEGQRTHAEHRGAGQAGA